MLTAAVRTLALTILCCLFFSESAIARDTLKVSVSLSGIPQGQDQTFFYEIFSMEGILIRSNHEALPHGRRRHAFEFRAERGDNRVLFVVGKILDFEGKVSGFAPVSLIDWSDTTRPQIDINFQIVDSGLQAFRSGFPFSAPLRANIRSHGIDAAVEGAKINFLKGYVDSQDSWNRVTSDFVLTVSDFFRGDNSRVERIITRIGDFVSQQHDPRYIVFHTRFLLAINDQRIGGTPVGGANLDQYIVAVLQRHIIENTDSIFEFIPSIIRSFPAHSVPNESPPCFRISHDALQASERLARSLHDELNPQKFSSAVTIFHHSIECMADLYIEEGGPAASRGDVLGMANYLKHQHVEIIESFISFYEYLSRRGFFFRAIYQSKRHTD